MAATWVVRLAALLSVLLNDVFVVGLGSGTRLGVVVELVVTALAVVVVVGVEDANGGELGLVKNKL